MWLRKAVGFQVSMRVGCSPGSIAIISWDSKVGGPEFKYFLKSSVPSSRSRGLVPHKTVSKVTIHLSSREIMSSELMVGYKRSASDAPDTSDDNGSQPGRGKEAPSSSKCTPCSSQFLISHFWTRYSPLLEMRTNTGVTIF